MCCFIFPRAQKGLWNARVYVTAQNAHCLSLPAGTLQSSCSVLWLNRWTKYTCMHCPEWVNGHPPRLRFRLCLVPVLLDEIHTVFTISCLQVLTVIRSLSCVCTSGRNQHCIHHLMPTGTRSDSFLILCLHLWMKTTVYIHHLIVAQVPTVIRLHRWIKQSLPHCSKPTLSTGTHCDSFFLFCLFLFCLLSAPLDKTLIASLLQAYSEYRHPLSFFFLSCACAAGAIHCIYCNPSHRQPQRFFLCPAPVPLDRILPFTGSSLQAPTEVLSLSCSCTFGLDTTLPFSGPSLQAPTDVLSPSCACTFSQSTAFYCPHPTGTHCGSFSILEATMSSSVIASVRLSLTIVQSNTWP